MTITDRAVRGHAVSLWSFAFRPFFLAAAIWAAVALTVWIIVFLSGGALPSRFDPLSWHMHAMLFGFVLAAIAGFMLTAISNWTGRPPIRGAPLIGLVALWTLGRIAVFVSILLPLWLTAAVDLAFPVALTAVAAREIVAAGSWRNLMMPLPIAVLGIADLLTYLETAGLGVPAGLGWRLAVAAVISLVSAIGGRIIPTFTRNWLVKRGATTLPADHGLIDRTALAGLHTSLLLWAFFPAAKLVGVILVAAGALNLWQLMRWQGLAILGEPLLMILHLGYGWIALGSALLGVTQFWPVIPESAAIHAFTAGAIGTMVLAVMTRVSRGHTGRPLQADRMTRVIYLLIVLAGVARVAASIAGDTMVLLAISAAFWVGGFGLFAVFYGPMLFLPRIDKIH